MKNKPFLPNLEPVLAMGINPETGRPIKMEDPICGLKDAMKKELRVFDQQNAVNRYRWYNLPSGITGQLLEKMLYYRGQVAFFYMKENNTFLVLPYTLSAPEGSTGIDVYGRFTGITPLVFNGAYDSKKEKPFIKGLVKIPQYEIVLPENLTIEKMEDSCVLLSDYTKQISQTNISRQILNDPLLDAMAEAFPMARTALLANSGIRGMRVQDENDQSSVKAASRSITRAALNGDPWIPFVGSVEFQDMTCGTNVMKPEEYLLYMQSLDNFRLGLYGLQSGGIFQKKEHMLQSEQDMNAGNVGLVYQDGLTNRQEFCLIVNSLWGLDIWCESSETVSGVDRDMNGVIQDDQYDGMIPGSGDDSGEGESEGEYDEL